MQPKVPLLQHPAETELFDGTLSCEGWLPVRFVAGDRPLLQQQSEALLHGLAVAEDLRNEDPDDRGELPQSIQRMEAKLDLILGLLGKLARQRDDALPVRPLRWSHLGLRLDLAQPVEAVAGTGGVALLQPVAWLSDHIELPVRILAQIAGSDGQHHLWLRFGALNAGLKDALERHLFRQHRRQIAEARQAALNSGQG